MTMTAHAPSYRTLAGTFQTNDKTVLNAEMDRLKGNLGAVNPGSPPKSLGLELSEEIRAISLPDEGLHPLVCEQAVQEGKITSPKKSTRKC
jgi:hypothetical protein